MQYFLNGFRPGDPSRAVRREDRLPDEVDVLIIGAGPAGLVLGAQLARFPGIATRVVERKSGPLRLGQADGVACRTVEMFEAFDLAEHLLKESYWVNETVFWRPSAQDRTCIERTGRIRDTPEGMSEFPHVIVNQARMLGYLLGCMRNGARRLVPDYGLEFTGLGETGDPAHPLEVRLREVDIGMPRRVRARYVVGCDGAHSAVRAALGRELHGDRANHAWGVMDILAVTDFPDIRLKAAIQSSDAGSILLIPREGGYLVRLYVDLGVVTDANRHALRDMNADGVVRIANRVLHPYRLEVRETAWFSIYEVAQRLTDAFDDAAGRDRDPHVFIAGDACHTHSAQAGQGMNVSMADAFNLGWKLAAVLRGQSDPALLRTYSAERQPVAQELIDFDREWAALMATHPRDPAHPEASGTDPDTLRDYYARGQRYTMGIATRYPPGLLTGAGRHQALAAGFPVGMRFHSVPVVRLADARRIELGHVAKADGRWRLYLFADGGESRLRALCEWLANASESPLCACTPAGADVDAVIDVRAVLQRPHRDVRVDALPALLLPHKGRYGLADYEKVFCAPGTDAPDAYAARGVDREAGCAVIVRPDQYVSEILPLDDHAGLRAFFARVLRARSVQPTKAAQAV